MRFTLSFAFFVYLTAVSINAFGAENTRKAELSLSAYTCQEFISDTAHPATPKKLIRPLMMISWASGYASAYDKSHLRSDEATFKLIAAHLGEICRSNPNEDVPQAFSNYITELASKNR